MGVTFLELLIVIMIIGLLATAALKAYDTSLQNGRFLSTTTQIDAIAKATVGDPDLISAGNRVDYGYVGDVGQLPDKLEDLMQAPAGAVGLWKGPYLVNRIAENPNGYMTDAWGDSLLYNQDSISVSSRRGLSILQPDSWITKRMAQSSDQLLRNTVSGLIEDSKGNTPDSVQESHLFTILEYPYLLHVVEDVNANFTNGQFQYPGRVPMGNRKLTVGMTESDGSQRHARSREERVGHARGDELG